MCIKIRAQELSEIRFQARSKDQEILEEGGAGLRKLDFLSLRFVPQQQCNGHCPCDCPSTAVETAIAQCTSRWAMARGHRLNTSIVLAGGPRSLRSFSGGIRGRAFTLSSSPPPPPPVPVPNKPSRFCGHKAKYTRTTTLCESRDGCPGLPVPNSPYGLCGCKATLNLNMCLKRRRTRVSSQSSGAVCTRRWCWVSWALSNIRRSRQSTDPVTHLMKARSGTKLKRPKK